MTEPEKELERLERALWDVVTGLNQRHIAIGIAQHAACDLPPASWALLGYLDRYGPMRVSDVATCQGVDVSSVTPRLQALEREGLITRETDPADRRASVISLDSAGRAALERVHAARCAILADAVTGLEESQVANASALLTRIAARLRQ